MFLRHNSDMGITEKTNRCYVQAVNVKGFAVLVLDLQRVPICFLKFKKR